MDLPPPHEKPRFTEEKRERLPAWRTGTESADPALGWRIFGLRRKADFE
jgi:hypothetical protein